MRQYTLKQEFRDKITESQTLKGMVADALGVTTRSIERYCEKNDTDLARPEVTELLKEQLRLGKSAELFDVTEVTEKQDA